MNMDRFSTVKAEKEEPVSIKRGIAHFNGLMEIRAILMSW